ncbi:MAG: Dam family site-specific DNA-(adenine-N6)-methyltransferase [Clostridia bacterium]|nr:Dam family site-specific DNA-(adenine-N6)-methyltransferase [Bacteroidales bacterium]MBR1654752.1 Dam family site-specific DNA-(adenine-N6)-methyltransferase [Clostridia bacterium]
MSIVVPPIKSQGIKTKLVPCIYSLIQQSGVDKNSGWIEPFFGTGVVGFNSPLKGKHIVGDTNPHIINFYKSIQSGEITAQSMRLYLETEGKKLKSSDEDGYIYFREVRDRFNTYHNPYDFIFLSRTGFNGMMRFNSKGDWNVPFCKKPERFAPAYITKICNQITHISKIINKRQWEFNNISFIQTIEKATENDIIYCDPPYFGRYADYFNGWTMKDEQDLYNALSLTKAKFILSTWHHNDYRSNDMIEKYWSNYNILTQEHYYHNGGKIENRHSMTESLIFNFDLKDAISFESERQLTLFA